MNYDVFLDDQVVDKGEEYQQRALVVNWERGSKFVRLHPNALLNSDPLLAKIIIHETLGHGYFNRQKLKTKPQGKLRQRTN